MTVSLLSSARSANLPRTTFTRRSFLLLRHDSLWLIKTGIVRTMTILEDGTSVTLGLWGPGDVVGRVLSKADPYQIECLTPVEADLLPAARWDEATEAMILHIQRSGELMEILHCRSAESSLLRLFIWLALTHQDMAELIASTRVTVTRLLSDLEKQGIIQRRERQFIVLHDQLPFWHYEI